MAKNVISRTISEAMDRIRREHGPDATIIKVWEFQRWNEFGKPETWVGVTVGEEGSDKGMAGNRSRGAERAASRHGKAPFIQEGVAEQGQGAVDKRHSVRPNPPGFDPCGSSPRVESFAAIQSRKQSDKVSAVESSCGRSLQAPLDPISAPGSQVLKATFQQVLTGGGDSSPQGTRSKQPSSEHDGGVEEASYSQIGGLGKELATLREMVEYPLRYPEMFQRLGIEGPRGVLLCGPPGCGKTLLARSIADATEAHFILVNGPELVGAYQGESERNLRMVFEEAEKHAPSIIFFDEIDAITPKRDEASGPEKRLVTQLLTLMDGMKKRGHVVVIGSTNSPDTMDPALRRPGRFDREVWFGPPDEEARLDILRVHTRYMALEDDVDLGDLASRTHGFVGADLANLCREAGLYAIREALPRLEAEASNSRYGRSRETHTRIKELLNNLRVGRAHFEAALKELKPASLRDQRAEIPRVKWQEIGGLDAVKRELEEAVIWPIRHPELFVQADLEPPRGILLAGPPGTGKTLLAKALASESGINFISVKGPSLVSKYVGESEKAIREIFAQARQAAPCILFLDEVDAIAPVRGADASSGFADRLVAQLLVEMDGIEKLERVLVLGATNRPEAIDPGLRRPGRFDRIIHVPAPDTRSRLEIFKVHTARKPLDKSVDLAMCASQTEGFTGADVESVCRLAALASVRRALIKPAGGPGRGASSPGDSAVIYPEDFDAAIREVRGQIQKQQIEQSARDAVQEANTLPLEFLPPSASQFLTAYQEVQKERTRSETREAFVN